MFSGAINVTCPRCGAVSAVPAALVGRACTCPQCRLMFLPPRPAQVSAPVAGPVPPHLLAQSASPMAPATPPELPASPPAKKQSALFSSGTWLELVLFVLITAVVVGGGGLAWLYWKGKIVLAGKAEPEKEHAQNAEPARPERVEEVVDAGPPRWSDAREVSLLLRGLKLRVENAEFGEILAKDDEHHVIPTDGQKYLAVFVTVKNVGQEPVEYHSWYAHGGRTLPKLQPTLTDGAGHTFPLKKFTGVAQIKGHTPSAKLARGDEISDVIIFHVPDDVPRDEVQFLRLKLPAFATGGEGFFRFEMPRSMVAGW